MFNKKRKLDSSQDENIVPQKKMKLDSSEVVSHLYIDEEDQNQFQDIFYLLKEIININIELNTIKDIAEYATGIITNCARCDTKMHVLKGDNGSKYKYCSITDKYYCLFCHTRKCDLCRALINTENCPECSNCEYTIDKCNECGCMDEHTQCDKCDKLYCDDCGDCDLLICPSCNGVFCEQCYKVGPLMADGEFCVCNKCYPDMVIKCSKCKIECVMRDGQSAVCYESYTTIGYELQHCDKQDCNRYICSNCKNTEYGGIDIYCNQKDCNRNIVYCKQHKDIRFCWKHI